MKGWHVMDNVTVRSATSSDVARLLEIYAHYVRETAITFEYEVPSEEEFARRMTKTLEHYPYLVIEDSDKVVGYAYAGPFKERAAYNWACELTIYLAPEARGRGLGRTLYTALEEALQKMGILNLYACIAYPEVEDEYLTLNSFQFHEHLGFALAGRFRQCGYKFSRWYDMVWMEKFIGEHRELQAPVVPYQEVK